MSLQKLSKLKKVKSYSYVKGINEDAYNEIMNYLDLERSEKHPAFYFHNIPTNELLEVSQKLKLSIYQTPFGFFANGMDGIFEVYISSISMEKKEAPYVSFEGNSYRIESILIEMDLNNLTPKNALN